MIARTPSNGFICLRCQFRLTASVPQRNPFIGASQIRVRRHGTESKPTTAANEKENELSQPLEIRKVDAPFDSHHGRRDLPSLNPDQFYRSRGKRLFMKPETLEIGILGKPAEAIVMKDVGNIRCRSPALVEEETETPQNRVDIWEALEAEVGEATLEEVQANIEELRPLDADIIPEREFQELGETLLNGFTTAQLNRYIQSKHKLAESTVSAMQTDYPWILEQVPWTPEVPEANEQVSLALRGYIGKTMTPKEKLVVRLIRECWNVSIQELMDGQGRLDVRLKELEFSLLMIGTQRWLQAISRAFLKPGKQIELIRSENRIRIVAPKATAETILSEINSRLRSAVTKSFKLRDVIPYQMDPTELPDASVLREVGRITNSCVRLDESGENVQVTWIGLEGRDPNLEDLSDTVFRLLVTAYKLTESTKSLHVFRDSIVDIKPSMDYANKETWAWKSRLEQWRRWIAPAAFLRNVKKDRLTEAILRWRVEAPTKDPPHDSLVSPFHSQAPYQATAPYEYAWSPALALSTTAVFGHVLSREQKPSPHLLAWRLPKRLNTWQDHVRIMSPVIPPMVNIALPSDLPPKSTTSTVLMHFVPVPTDPRADSAPPLELRLDTSDPENLSVTSLRASLATHTSDVLLPAEAVDVRITQTRTHSLPGTALSATHPGTAPLVSFLDKSHLNLQEGSLTTPARVHALGLPKRLLRPIGKYTECDEDLVEIDYLFAGLEAQRAVATSFKGFKLVYTSIEAGQGGGRRSELSLEAVRAADPEVAVQEVTTEAFIEAVSAMARGKEVKWIGENWKYM